MSLRDLDAAEGVSRCTEDDLPELRAFRAQMYEASNRVHDRSRADWLFLRHPLRPSEGPAIWICRRDGQIVGTVASIPFDVKVDDEYHVGSWGVDLMVDPEWRGRGIAPALSEVRRGSCRVSAGLSISDAAHRSALRRRSTDMGSVPMLLRLVDPKAILGWEGAPPLVRHLVLPLATPALWLLAQASRIRSSRTSLVPIDAFDQRADDLWQKASVRYRIICRRDAAWLRWRFDECPHRDAYLRYYVLHGQEPIGYLVLRWTTWGGRQAVKLIDYLAAPDNMTRLLEASLGVARQLGAAAVLCDAQNAKLRNTFRTCGFFRRRHQGIRFLAYTDTEELKAVVCNPDNWFVTSADSDLD